MPPSPWDFAATMASLNSLVAADLDRRQRNRERQSAMIRTLDDPLGSPSSDEAPTATRASTPPPMTRVDPSDGPDARDRLPARTTRGGAYGDSIIDRVLASYGLD